MTAATNRKPKRYAGPGAVRGQGDSREIKTCNRCGDEFVFVESKRTGNWYRARVYYGQKGQAFYMKNQLHDCDKRLAEIAEFDALAVERAKNLELNARYSARLREVVNEPEWFNDETLWQIVNEMTGKGKDAAVNGLIEAMREAGKL